MSGKVDVDDILINASDDDDDAADLDLDDDDVDVEALIANDSDDEPDDTHHHHQHTHSKPAGAKAPNGSVYPTLQKGVSQDDAAVAALVAADDDDDELLVNATGESQYEDLLREILQEDSDADSSGGDDDVEAIINQFQPPSSSPPDTAAAAPLSAAATALAPLEADNDLKRAVATIKDGVPAIPDPASVSTAAVVAAAGMAAGSAAAAAPTRDPADLAMPADVDGDRLAYAESQESALLTTGNTAIISPLQSKRRLRNKSRGRTRSLTHKRASRLQSAAGMIKVESLETVTRQLKKNAMSKAQGPGLPTAVSIHDKFIAIGTSRSLVLVFDHFQDVRQVLQNAPASGGETDGPVTAIDVSRASDYLVCGYLSGRVVLWDIMRGTSLRTVSDVHSAPICSVRFVQDKSVSVMSVDTTGAVNLITFTKFLRWSHDHVVLLDGAAGQIVAVSVLLPPTAAATHPSPNVRAALAAVDATGTLIALSSRTCTYIVTLQPDPRVVFKWDRPTTGVATDELPSLSWARAKVYSREPGSSRVAGGGSGTGYISTSDFRAPVLVRGWGRHLQFLQVQPFGGYRVDNPQPGRLQFAPIHDLETSSSVTALDWLGESVLVYMNTEYELVVFDTIALDELETTDVADLKPVFASYGGGAAGTSEVAREAAPSSTISFQNSFRACHNTLYLLGLAELRVARVQSWTERIDAFVAASEWLDALALALDHYDDCVREIIEAADAAEDRARYRHETLGEEFDAGKFEKMRHRPVSAHVQDRASSLLMQFVDLMFTSAANVVGNTTPPPPRPSEAVTSGKGRRGSVRSTVDYLDHYALLAGVCVDYCVATGRTDLLFTKIFERFMQEKQQGVLLEMLEPYILNDRILALAPEVLKEFVQHCKQHDMLHSVERCLLHLDLQHLDIDEAVRTCIRFKLFSALVNVFNRGLHDYTTPIDILLAAVFDNTTPAPAVGDETNITNMPSLSEDERRGVGYKLLLYLQYCLAYRAFPRGDLPREVLITIRADVVSFLLEARPSMFPCFSIRARTAEPQSFVPGPHPRLQALLLFDTKALLDILTIVFDENAAQTVTGESMAPADARNASALLPADATRPAPTPQDILSALSAAVLPYADPNIDRGIPAPAPARRNTQRLTATTAAAAVAAAAAGGASAGSTPSSGTSTPQQVLFNEEQVGTFFTFAAQQLSRKGSSVTASSELLVRVARFLARRDDNALERQTTLVHLLERCPLDMEKARDLLARVERAGLYRAAVVLYKQAGDFAKVVDSFVSDPDPSFRAQVFDYVMQQVDAARAAAGDSRVSDDPLVARYQQIKRDTLQRLPALLGINEEQAANLMQTRFPSDSEQVLQQLHQYPLLRLKYLRELIKPKGTTPAEPTEETPVDATDSTPTTPSTPAVSSKLQFEYIQLLCELEPQNVRAYLDTATDSYPLDATLDVCRKHKIVDATAYLYEHMSDVNSALDLYRESLAKAYMELQTVCDAMEKSAAEQKERERTMADDVELMMATMGTAIDLEKSVESTPQYQKTVKLLTEAIALCDRNTHRGAAEGESLWFALLDEGVRHQQSVKVRKMAPNKAGGAAPTPSPSTPTGSEGKLMQRCLYTCTHMILEAMKSKVPLNVILSRIIKDHGTAEFKEFKTTILGMLDTYGYEQRILKTANDLLVGDMFRCVAQYHSGVAKAFSPKSDKCADCNGFLSVPPTATVGLYRSQMMIIVFGCQHAFHDACIDGNTQSCPLCRREQQSKPHRARRSTAATRVAAADGSHPSAAVSLSSSDDSDDDGPAPAAAQDDTATAGPAAAGPQRRPLFDILTELQNHQAAVNANPLALSVEPEVDRSFIITRRAGNRRAAQQAVNANRADRPLF